MTAPPPLPRAAVLAALFRRARGMTPPRRVWGYHSGTGRGGELAEDGSVKRNEWATIPPPRGAVIDRVCVEGGPEGVGKWVRLPTE